MKRKRVLILGAGVYQIPLIEKALAMGLHVSAATYRATDPGLRMVHDPWIINTTDKNGLLRRAKLKKIDAVTTTGTDVAVASQGYLCDHLDLPGPSFKTALNATNKILMKRCFNKHGVPTAPWWIAKTLKQAADVVAHNRGPFVFKCPDSSGSRGLSIVTHPSQVTQAFWHARKFTRGDSIIIEKKLTGIFFGTQTIMVKGTMRYFSCLNSTLAKNRVPVSLGHSVPSRMPLKMQKEAARRCEQAARALGIRNAVCDADAIWTRDGIQIIEMAARMGSCGIPEILSVHSGIDFYQVVLDLALGRKPRLKKSNRAAAASILLHAQQSGVVRDIQVPPTLASAPGFVSYQVDCIPGDRVQAYRIGPHRIGDLIVKAATANKAEKRAKRLGKLIRFRLDRSSRDA